MFEYIYFICDIKFFLIIFGVYLFYKLGKIKHNLHLKLGHEGPPPLPYLGNFYDIFRFGFYEYDRMCLKKYGKIYPFYFCNIKLSVISDEELLKQIMIKEAKCFTDRMDPGMKGKNTEKMLTVLKGKDWERVRNLVSPTFTSGKLRKMSSLISDCIKTLEEHLTEYSNGEPIDIKEFYGALTMDVIAQTMFGMHINSQENPKNLFIIHAKRLFKFTLFNPVILLFLIFPECAWLIRKITPKWAILGRSTFQFFSDNLLKAIEKRQESSEIYNDFLTLMLNAHKEVDNKDETLDYKALTLQEIMCQSLIFLLAGYDTTATTIMYVTYFLAKNQDAQKEVYEEICNIVGVDGDLNYESLMNMPLLNAAISETLRICPPIVRTDRKCTQDVTLTTSLNEKIFARKGDIFTIPIYAIHTNPSIWLDPDVFDLHRFDPENRKKHSPYSFMPFGMGPRSCIGMRFALLEIKWVMATVLRKFKLMPCEETLENVKFKKEGLCVPIKPIILKIVKRD